MNHIYRSIWNATLGTWVAAPETARTATTQQRRTRRAPCARPATACTAVAWAIAALGIAHDSHAQMWTRDVATGTQAHLLATETLRGTSGQKGQGNAGGAGSAPSDSGYYNAGGVNSWMGYSQGHGQAGSGGKVMNIKLGALMGGQGGNGIGGGGGGGYGPTAAASGQGGVTELNTYGAGGAGGSFTTLGQGGGGGGTTTSSSGSSQMHSSGGGGGGLGLHLQTQARAQVAGTVQGGQGGAGKDSNVYNGGGGGGGGGAAVWAEVDSQLEIASSARIQGGQGGYSYHSGGGGAGILGQGYQLTNHGTILGGQGGQGTRTSGGGGAGVAGQSFVLRHLGGAITGGQGGSGDADGQGGAGVGTLGGATVTTAALIAGGLNGQGTQQALALDFQGGGNTLELQHGYAWQGDVRSDGTGDTLALGGSTDSRFDLGQLVTSGVTSTGSAVGTATRYQGFTEMAKLGSSTWTIVGSAPAASHWTVQAGTLQIGDADTSSTLTAKGMNAMDVLAGGHIDLQAGSSIHGKTGSQGNTSTGGRGSATGHATYGNDGGNVAKAGQGAAGSGGKSGPTTHTSGTRNLGGQGGDSRGGGGGAGHSKLASDGAAASGQGGLATGAVSGSGGGGGSFATHGHGGGGGGGNNPTATLPYIGGGGGGGGVGLQLHTGAQAHVAGTVYGGTGGKGRNPSGGGGGGGVALWGDADSQMQVSSTGRLQGGQGGAAAYSGGGGAAVLGQGFQLHNLGQIQGGQGGQGTAASGGGGAGVSGQDFVLTHEAGSITGGQGGTTGAQGLGGIGVGSLGGATVTTAALIAGGLNGSGTQRGLAVDFQGGGNTLQLHHGYQWHGDVRSNGAGAGDTLVLGGSTDSHFDLDQLVASGVSSTRSATSTTTRYQGFAHYRKTGDSTWTLSGTQAVAGNWTVDAGTVHLSPSSILGNSITLAQGSRMTGTGTVGRSANGTHSTLSVERGATLAPGDAATPYGTLHVEGDVRFASGAVLAIQVDPDSAANSRLDVTGTATLGGFVEHLATGASYSVDRDYTILHAAGGLQGSFMGVMSDYAYLDSTLSYDNGTDVVLRLRRAPLLGLGPLPPTGQPTETTPTEPPPLLRFSDLAETPNQRAVANSVESLPQQHALFQFVETLPQGAPASVFNSLSGDMHANVSASLGRLAERAVELGSARLQRNLTAGWRPGAPVAQSAGPLPAAAWPASQAQPAWVELVGHQQRYGSDGNAAATRQRTTGLFLGADAPVGQHHWRVGASLGYSQSQAQVQARAAEADIGSYSASLYAGRRWGQGLYPQWHALGGLAYSHHTVATRRQVPQLNQSLRADYHAHTVHAFAQVGYAWVNMPDVQLEPFVALSLGQHRTHAFAERGGSAALQGQAQRQDLGSATFGLRWQQHTRWAGHVLRMHTTLGARQAVGPRHTTHSLALAGSQPFTVTHTAGARQTALLQWQAEWELSPRSSLAIGYQGEWGQHQREQAANATVRWAF